MKITRALFCATFAIFFPLTIGAQSQGQAEKISLTIQKAVDLALKNNITIKQNQIKLDAAKRAKDTSWNSVSPSLTASGGLSKSNKNFASNYSAYVQGSVSVSLSTNLYTNIKNAALKYQAGEISYETARRSVEMNARSAFYKLLYHVENIKLQVSDTETAKETYETNRRKYEQGAISQLDVLSSQVNYESQMLKSQSAQIDYENDLALFKQTLGLDQETQIELIEDLEKIAKISSISIDGIERSSLELSALEKNLEIAKNSLLASRFSAYGPTLNAGWTYKPTWSNTSSGTDTGGLSLSISIPLDGLLPWSTKANNIASAKDTIADYELQIADKKTSLQVEAQIEIKKIEQLISSIKSLESSVALAEQSHRMTQEAYNRGTRNFTELLNARSSLEKARLNLKQQAYNLASSILNLENTLGLPFGTLSGEESDSQGDKK
ncbi:MAG: TolC family protein [Treponema sp.]|nr:TolC family protein [Treponema sp.]